MESLLTDYSSMFAIGYVVSCVVASTVALYFLWKDPKLHVDWQDGLRSNTRTPKTYTGATMPGNIIVISNRARTDSTHTANAVKLSHEMGIKPYTTYTETISASAYWRMAKRSGLFNEVDSLANLDTVVLVVDRYDEICDGAINPDLATLNRFVGMVIAPDKPSLPKQSLPLSPLAEDALSGPRPRRV